MKYYEGPILEDYIQRKGDLLVTMKYFSKQADTLGLPVFVTSSEKYNFLHNQRLGRIEFKEGFSHCKEYIYILFCSHRYRHHIVGSATGSTVKHSSPTILENFSLHFSSLLEQVFLIRFKSLFDLIDTNNIKNVNLQKLRDTLLLKLLAGKLNLSRSEY